jgi:hypothetical protein
MITATDLLLMLLRPLLPLLLLTLTRPCVMVAAAFL